MNEGRTVSPTERKIYGDNDRQNDELKIKAKSLKKANQPPAKPCEGERRSIAHNKQQQLRRPSFRKRKERQYDKIKSIQNPRLRSRMRNGRARPHFRERGGFFRPCRDDLYPGPSR